MTALILVDLLNDFVEGGALAVPGGKEIIPLINRIQLRFELIVATQDWHPANHGSFAANNPGRKVGDVGELGGLPQVFWPVHCVQESFGADFVPGLERKRWAAIFQKGIDPGIDSYSGFFDNAHRRSTKMGEYLRERDVTSVFIAGLATDYCVKATVLDAAEKGFAVTLIEDACRGVELHPGDVLKAVEEMRQAGVKIVRGEEWE
jgi:nicotinamidase/pyrazinamidase